MEMEMEEVRSLFPYHVLKCDGIILKWKSNLLCFKIILYDYIINLPASPTKKERSKLITITLFYTVILHFHFHYLFPFPLYNIYTPFIKKKLNYGIFRII